MAWPREGGDVAGLAGDLLGVAGENGVALVGGAHAGMAIDAADALFTRVDAAGDFVRGAAVAVDAGHVRAIGTHVDVEGPGRIGEGRVEVAVLDRVAAAAVEVAGAAIAAIGKPHGLGGLEEIDGLEHDAGPGGEFLGRLAEDGQTGASGEFFVNLRIGMADEAVDVVGVGKIELGVGIAIADVAGGAAGFVGRQGDAEIVDDVLLAEVLARGRILVGPGPMDGLHDLVRGVAVATKAGCRDLLGLGEGAGNQRRVILAHRVDGGLRRLVGDLGRGGRSGAACQREAEGSDRQDAYDMSCSHCYSSIRRGFSAPALHVIFNLCRRR